MVVIYVKDVRLGEFCWVLMGEGIVDWDEFFVVFVEQGWCG